MKRIRIREKHPSLGNSAALIAADILLQAILMDFVQLLLMVVKRYHFRTTLRQITWRVFFKWSPQ